MTIPTISRPLYFLICFTLLIAFSARGQVLDSTITEGIEKPGFIEYDLNNSLPKEESLFRGFLMPDNYDDLKEDLYEETSIKLSVSYQSTIMRASNVLDAPSTAAAGLFLIEAEWTPLNYGKDYQGGIVVSYNNIHGYGSNAQPPLFFLNTGSMFPHDALYLDVNPFLANLYWEQWFKKDRFWVRIGQHAPVGVVDFSRYADVRTSVTNPAIGFPAGIIPFGPPAMGLTAKLLPSNPTGFYFLGHLSDINSRVDVLNVGQIFETGELFVAGEIGHNWIRKGAGGLEMDHLHLLVFSASDASKKVFPTAGGWGFKLAGEKQMGNWVGLLSYAYNTATGGGFGFTNLQHAINAGAAYNKPFGIKGEAFLAMTWARELNEGPCGAIPCSGRSQAMLESYWKILVLPELWLTPGLQMHFNPVNNPNTGLLWVPLLKFRAFF